MDYYFSNNKELFSPLEGNRIKCALPNTGSQEKRMVIRIVVDLLVHSIFKCAPLDATISQFITELIERKVILAQKMASFTWNFRCNISLGKNSYWASFPSRTNSAKQSSWREKYICCCCHQSTYEDTTSNSSFNVIPVTTLGVF